MHTDDDMIPWRQIPAAIISDELQRSAGMTADITPISVRTCFVGEALTVHTMVGDNSALHVAANAAPAGCVLVVNAGGYLGTAVWGEILHSAALRRGVAAIVIDGAIRDRAILADSPIPVFARGSTPNGPHKGWGGMINGTIQCGGISVAPHDLIVGDRDGVVVIDRQQMPGLLERCKRRIGSEAAALARIRQGVSTLEALCINVEVVSRDVS
jgi:regulator of RNase E activity RraA